MDLIRQLFAADARIHSFSCGVCTAHKSPGNFALVRDRDGNVLAQAEAPDAEDATRMLFDRLRPPPAASEPTMPMMPTLPGMTTR